MFINKRIWESSASVKSSTKGNVCNIIYPTEAITRKHHSTITQSLLKFSFIMSHVSFNGAVHLDNGTHFMRNSFWTFWHEISWVTKCLTIVNSSSRRSQMHLLLLWFSVALSFVLRPIVLFSWIHSAAPDITPLNASQTLREVSLWSFLLVTRSLQHSSSQ